MAAAEALRRLVRERGARDIRQMFGPSAAALSVLVPDLVRDGTLGATDRTGVHLAEAFVSGQARAGGGAGGAVWLWFEDLQWADGATRSLVPYLLRMDGPPN